MRREPRENTQSSRVASASARAFYGAAHWLLCFVAAAHFAAERIENNPVIAVGRATAGREQRRRRLTLADFLGAPLIEIMDVDYA